MNSWIKFGAAFGLTILVLGVTAPKFTRINAEQMPQVASYQLDQISEQDIAADEIWLFEQNFVKFGKKELFEKQSMEWIRSFAPYAKKKKSPALIGVQDLEDSEYIYLIPIGNIGDLKSFSEMRKGFKNTFDPEIWVKKIREMNSTLNYKIYSLQQYKTDSSYIPSQPASDLFNTPHIYYHIISLTPGGETFFETYLTNMANKYYEENSPCCWRTWKVIFGSDVPKYVIGIFAANKEMLQDHIKRLKFIDSSVKPIVRDHKEGKAILRRDLTYFPSQK